MPGIVGIISQRPAEQCQRLVDVMVASMENERFYTSGTYFVPEMGVYGGSVAFEEFFPEGEVFFNEQKDIALIFSGECFMDSEIPSRLRQNGHAIAEGPGDWLVHLYEEQGDRYFENLNGLFSGLLIDKRQKRAFLFNDRYGFDRIYLAETNDGLYFATEAKALLQVLPESRAFSSEGVAQFLALGCTVEGSTLFQGIRLLPGASVWSFKDQTCRKARYFSPATWESQPVLSPDAFESQFQHTFKRILPRYFGADSKIGISLTAGLDSRMLMACRPDLAQKPICYTFSGSESETLDSRLASQIAQACQCDHHTVRIGPDFFSDFASHVDRTVYLTDGYFGAVGAHEAYLNRAARQLAPVRLTGVFGGEILRGTSTFKPIGLVPDLLDSGLRREVDVCAQQFGIAHEHPTTFAAFKEIPWSIFGSVAACRSQVSFRTPYLDNELVALAFQISDCLRTSSDSAIRFVEQEDATLSQIPTDMGELGNSVGLKSVWRNFFSKMTFKLDYWSNDGMPHWLSPFDPVLDRLNSDVGLLGLHKYLRYRRWFRRELSGYLKEMLSARSVRQSTAWNASFVSDLAENHIRGRRNYVQEINAVLTLDAVQRLLLRQP